MLEPGSNQSFVCVRCVVRGPLMLRMVICSLSLDDILKCLVSKLGTLQFIQNLFKIDQEVKCSKDDRCQPAPDC